MSRHPLIGTVTDRTDGIYVGRLSGCMFGNPFKIGQDGTREVVIQKYRQWLHQQVGDDPERWLPALAALHGERLLCHCAPQRCHAEVLVTASAWAFAEIGGIG